MLCNINSGHPTNIGTGCGVDSEGPSPVEDEDYQVAVPEININLTDEQNKQLCNSCDPLQNDGNCGKNIFAHCKDLLLNIFHL